MRDFFLLMQTELASLLDKWEETKAATGREPSRPGT
jgi:hypothetical protein